MTIPVLTGSPLPSANSFLTQSVAPAPKQALGQADFLKLLTTQLSNQDPLKPMDDTQFIAEMAQFSALQQSTKLTTDFEGFSSAQQITAAQGLIGRTVTLTASDGTMTTGPVSAVQIQNGAAQIVVNGMSYDPSTVTAVTTTASSTTGP